MYGSVLCVIVSILFDPDISGRDMVDRSSLMVTTKNRSRARRTIIWLYILTLLALGVFTWEALPLFMGARPANSVQRVVAVALVFILLVAAAVLGFVTRWCIDYTKVYYERRSRHVAD